MAFLQLRELTLRYGAVPLLNGINLQIEPGERIALLGRNGAGKTSLMRLITGEETPNEGEIIRSGEAPITRLDQEIPGAIDGSVLTVVRSGIRPDTHEEEWQSDIRIEDLILEMKLPADLDFSQLSGGLKRRVLLARALAGQPALLLLDEPTNHLDLEAILWLEEYLQNSPQTLFFVTHDRTFLRHLATRIVELDRGKLTSWACDYDTFLERKAVFLETEEKQWALFDKKLAQEEAWLRQGVKARRTRNEGRVRALHALRTERSHRREREGVARIELQDGSKSGQKVIEAENISFSYGKRTLLRDFSTTIWRGDKIGIIGPNGGGKTTLLKLLLGQLEPESGTVKLGTRLQTVYLDQLRDQIDPAKTVAQNVAGDAETVTFQGQPRHIHSYLQDFLFRSDRIRMPAKMLSGGERNRLLLARLFLQPANVLVLDEPTNDLDAETLELLEEILIDYTGTLLLVSHDRAFLDAVVTNMLVFEDDGRVAEYAGGYEDWRQQTAARREPSPVVAAVPVAKKSVAAKAAVTTPATLSEREKRELQEMPSQLERFEAEQATLLERLADPLLARNQPELAAELSTELSALERRLQEGYARWEQLEARRLAAQKPEA